MPMSKKHFQAIADVISQAKRLNDDVEMSHIKTGCEAALLQVALNIAEICKRDNQAFDKGRFMTACGFSDRH